MIQVASQSQGLGLQLAIRLHPIHQIAGIGQQLLRVEIIELIGPPQLSKGVGHLAQHQLGSKHQRCLTDLLSEPRCGGIAQNQPHGRRGIEPMGKGHQRWICRDGIGVQHNMA